MQRTFFKRRPNNADALMRALNYCYSLLNAEKQSATVDSLCRLLQLSDLKSADYFKEYLPLVNRIITLHNGSHWDAPKLKASDTFKKAFAMMLASFSQLKPNDKVPENFLMRFDSLLIKLVEAHGSHDLLKHLIVAKHPESTLFSSKVNLSQVEFVHTKKFEHQPLQLEMLFWGLASFFEDEFTFERLKLYQAERKKALKALPEQTNLYFHNLPSDIMEIVVEKVRESEAQMKHLII